MRCLSDIERLIAVAKREQGDIDFGDPFTAGYDLE